TAREAALLSALGRWAIEGRLVPFTRTLESGIDKGQGALAASAQRELLTLMRELAFVGIPAHPAAPGVREGAEGARCGARGARLRRHAERASGPRTVAHHGAHHDAGALRRPGPQREAQLPARPDGVGTVPGLKTAHRGRW